MADSCTAEQGDSLQSIAKQQGVSLQELKAANPDLGSRNPPYEVKPGDIIKTKPAQRKGNLKEVRQACKCKIIDLKQPFLIAIAKDGKIIPMTIVQSDDGPLLLGQDATHHSGLPMANGQPEVGSSEAELKSTMNHLLAVFAGSDSDGNAKKLFDAFQKKNSSVQTYTDPGLDKAVGGSTNFKSFSNRTLNAPGMGDPSKTRIHQELKAAGWDINQVKRIDDLGIPAFNDGNKSAIPFRNSGDWANGLAVMINGVQYVFVYVTKYHYDSCKQSYEIELKFVLYDVFGLDDIDLQRYGVTHRGSLLMATNGISAWWQLQHQHDYAPLLAKAVATRRWTVSTAGP